MVLHSLDNASLPITFDPLINLATNNYNLSMKCGAGGTTHGRRKVAVFL